MNVNGANTAHTTQQEVKEAANAAHDKQEI